MGKAIHEEKAASSSNSEIFIDNICLDRLTFEYLTEIKKSDADENACKWQLLYYLMILKQKGIIRKGKLEFVEKNKVGNKIVILELTESEEVLLSQYIHEVEILLDRQEVPPVIKKKYCKQCAYYEYCYI